MNDLSLNVTLLFTLFVDMLICLNMVVYQS